MNIGSLLMLELRREILLMVMRKHQRYFPIHGADGTLLPAFVTIANGAVDEPTVRVRYMMSSA